MPRQPAPEDEKRIIWSRIVESALKHHRRENEYGIQKVVAADANVSQQTVSKWKQLRVKPEPATLRKLATVYGVSSTWISGFDDDEPTPGVPQPMALPGRSKEEMDQLHATAIDIVEKVVINLLPDADLKTIMGITNRALGLLNDGKDPTQVAGTIFQEVADKKAGLQPDSQ